MPARTQHNQAQRTLVLCWCWQNTRSTQKRVSVNYAGFLIVTRRHRACSGRILRGSTRLVPNSYGLFILEVIESGVACLYSRSSSQVWFVYTRVRYGGPLESWGRFSVGSGRGFRRHVRWGENLKVLCPLCATYPGTDYDRASRGFFSLAPSLRLYLGS